MRNLEKTMKALANRRRLGIVKPLKKDGAVSVADIAREIGLSFKATSKHLGVLKAADIVESDQRSVRVFYHLVSAQKPAAARIIALL